MLFSATQQADDPPTVIDTTDRIVTWYLEHFASLWVLSLASLAALVIHACTQFAVLQTDILEEPEDLDDMELFVLAGDLPLVWPSACSRAHTLNCLLSNLQS